MIEEQAKMIEELEKKAGEEGWGGEFREEMFDLFLSYFTRWRGRKSLGSLLSFLCNEAGDWFVVIPKEKRSEVARA